MDEETKEPIQPDTEEFPESRASSVENERTVSVGGGSRSGGEPDRVRSPAGLPETIGPYRIVGQLGEGGIGIVYEAEQQQPKRRVALKVMKGGPFIGEDHSRLLQREAETLARLKHPNIGSIYEAGRTEEGQHFFAMELVRGKTLDEWLRARMTRLDSDEMRLRLRMFRRIADAVHYAHQRGVIHRDLKPSNIIITDEVSSSGTTGSLSPLPDVKILDFGLARITDQDVSAASLVTEIGVIKGTLPYMSPEQARGNPDEIDVRTDVYALGIILYEMLSGRRPYDVARSALVEAVRVICEDQPQPLRETWTGVHRLNRDVETIVGKALEKEADRRYGSAAALSEDVDRYLGSQPILARPPSAGYQIKMMVARHRISFVALMTILVVIVGASVVSTVQYLRAERAAEQARTEAEKSDQVAAFLQSMIEGAGPAVARGRDATLLKEILDETSERVYDELTDQPEVQAAVLSTLGITHMELGDFTKAEPLLVDALETYRAIEEKSADVAQSLNNMGTLHYRAGNYEESERFYRGALEMRQELLGEANEETADTITDLGNVIVSMGRYDEAEPYLREALALKRELYGGPDPALAISINSLGNLMHHREVYGEAEILYREALAMHRETLGEDHPDVMIDLGNLAYLMKNKGDLAQSEALFREVLEADLRLYGDSHPRVAISLGNMGMILHRQADYAGAEAYYRQALEIQRETLGDENPDLASTLNSIGMTYGERGDYTTARSYYRQALAMHRATLGEDHSWVVSDLNNVAYSLMNQDRLDEAEEVFREALELSIRVLGENDSSTQQLKNNIGRLLRRQGDLEGAEALFREVLQVRIDQMGEAHPSVALTRFDLGRVVEMRGGAEEGEELFIASMEGYRGSYGPDHTATAFAECRVARFHHARGEYDEAEKLLRHASAIIAETYGGFTQRGSSGTVLLARTLAAKGEEDEAEEIFDAATAAGVEALGKELFARVQIYRGELLMKQGRFDEAGPLLRAGYEDLRDSLGSEDPETREAKDLLADLDNARRASTRDAG